MKLEPESPAAAPEPDERQLLADLRAGSRSAAELLVGRTYTRVYAYLVRVSGNPDLASDLTQEAYRKAWQNLDSFDGRSQLATWITRIAYTTYLDHVRRPRLFTQLSETTHPPPDPATPALEALEQKEVEERLRLAVLELPEELRFSVTARFWGELPVDEIARLSGITGVAVRKRLARAYAALKGAIEGRNT
ncbi:MAG: sigma-70 family RNA polymerase sigma factor [Acidobacteria bacterium]|nr:sigma-70 family RNA polymerase sigma factor [Acidobacteriota bacterium]